MHAPTRPLQATPPLAAAPVAARAARELLTTSRLSAFRTCARYEYYSYQRGVRARRATRAMRFGTAGHLALEAYWKARQQADRNGWAAKARLLSDGAARYAAWLYAQMAAAIATVSEEDLDAYDRALLLALLAKYEARWRGVDVEVLGVEVEFQAPLLDPDTAQPSASWLLAGKMDALVRDRASGHVWIVEHKFTTQRAEAGSCYRERLAIDGQVDQYFIGAETCGYPADFVMYDVVRRPPLKPRLKTETCEYTLVPPQRPPGLRAKKGQPIVMEGPAWRKLVKGRERDETPEEFQERVYEFLEAPVGKRGKAGAEDAPGEDADAVAAPPVAPSPNVRYNVEDHFYQVRVPRAADARVEYAQDVWNLAWMMDTMRRRGIAPRNADACARYGGMCAFWPVCSGQRSLEDPTLYRAAASVHEELGRAEPEGDDAYGG